MSSSKSNNLPKISTSAEGAENVFVLDNVPLRRERKFPNLELKDTSELSANTQPTLVIQSPKTPTLSRKLKAVSLDSDPPKNNQNLEINRDVFSMPNTPKKQVKHKYTSDFDDIPQKASLAPNFSSNLKRFASNSSISGSQTLKTLPEIMTLQDFSSENRVEPVRIKTKGLLERRGSNASLTIDLTNLDKPVPISQLNTAKSVSNLNLTSFGGSKCDCIKCPSAAAEEKKPLQDRRKSQTHLETCGNCTIYESIPSKSNICKSKYQNVHKKCNCICNSKCGRKSLSNENLYVPPCNFCNISGSKSCSNSSKHCKGHRRACYPRQADLEASQMLSEDFKMHLQNVQYLQTAGSVLSVADLKLSCEQQRVPKLHQEFWEVPLNLQEKCLVSGSQTRNRYRGVLPNEHSRVHLTDEQPYIHANYIKGPDYTETAYIATQGPMANTCVDFWEMVWMTKCNCIVMLTQLVEKGRNKCELYFPLGKRPNIAGKSYYIIRTTRVADKFTFDTTRMNKKYEEEIIKHEEVDEVTYGKYTIKYISKDTIGDCTIRHLKLERRIAGANMESRIIKHYWYPNWQDHKMADPVQVLKIALHVMDFIDNNSRISDKCILKKPPVVKTRISHSETRFGGENSTFRQNMEHFRKMSGESERKVMKKSSGSSGDEEHQNKRPLVVHCSAGIGRTGCFLAILNGLQQLRSNFNVDVLAIVCSLRLHRGGMVQTAEQYELIHQVLSLYTELMSK